MRKTIKLLFAALLIGTAYLCASCSNQERSTNRTDDAPKIDASLSNQEQNKNRTDNSQISDASLEQVQPQVVDAISGKPINKNVYTDYRGVRIYFCCAESRRRFENNPEPYIQKLKEQYIIKEPSSGEKADTSLSNQEQNKNRTDNAQISGASLEQVQPQVVDAISGKPINKNVYTDYRGVRIYFCCEESRRRFQNNPQKYIESLKEQYIVKESSSEGK